MSAADLVGGEAASTPAPCVPPSRPDGGQAGAGNGPPPQRAAGGGAEREWSSRRTSAHGHRSFHSRRRGQRLLRRWPSRRQSWGSSVALAVSSFWPSMSLCCRWWNSRLTLLRRLSSWRRSGRGKPFGGSKCSSRRVAGGRRRSGSFPRAPLLGLFLLARFALENMDTLLRALPFWPLERLLWRCHEFGGVWVFDSSWYALASTAQRQFRIGLCLQLVSWGECGYFYSDMVENTRGAAVNAGWFCWLRCISCPGFAASW